MIRFGSALDENHYGDNHNGQNNRQNQNKDYLKNFGICQINENWCEIKLIYVLIKIRILTRSEGRSKWIWVPLAS